MHNHHGEGRRVHRARRTALAALTAALLLAASAGFGQEAGPGPGPDETAGQTAEPAPPVQPPEQNEQQNGQQSAEPAAEQSAEPAAEQTAEQAPEVPVQESLTGSFELLANPVYPPDRARLVYQPLIDYLNDATGLEIELVVDLNFHRYWLDARRNEAAPLVLEDAHMAAWRMAHFDYRPLVTTSDSLTFSLLTSGAYADDSLEDFVGRRIASLPSPSLGYVVLADWYDNPMQQPLIQSTATSWLDAVEMIFSAEADAAIAPENLVERYPNLYPVRTSVEFPGLTLSASPDVPDDVRRKLIEAMTTLHDDADHHSALFELDIDRFVEADPANYRGLEEWLSTIFAL
ncbi:MAG: PhnD/SsuA/transferrin family substrate-binding protein [Wenzhouxiangellaceae bacterium]|nr:PhnD/SsuA/transferrin family substrate-binding protein [Wenzhouxiangellaceae bacterium]